MKHLLCAIVLAGCTSSGHLTPEAKSAVVTVDDIARQLCLLAHADAVGISVQDVARGVCAAEAAFAPFRPFVIVAARQGGVAAGISRTDGGAR